MNNVNTLTAYRYYALAEECKCAKLRKKIVDYFRDEYAELSLNDEFKELIRTYPELSAEILLPLIERNTQSLVIAMSCILAIVVISQLKRVFL
jgi:hypothetical protein